jgi:hypothetical protein
MAPIEMAWQGKSIGEICRQIKDPGLNGGRDLTLLHDHLANDDLVAWGWQPGAGREPAPGSQTLFRRVDPGVDRYRSPVPLAQRGQRMQLIDAER